MRFRLNDQTETITLASNDLQLQTDLAPRIRIGRTFYSPDERYANARFACLQIYDMPMSFEEVAALSNRCETLTAGVNGRPDGLVLMYPFDKQHYCRSSVPLMQTQSIENTSCALVEGPRGRCKEALRLVLSTITSDLVKLRPLDDAAGVTQVLVDQASSFTLMFYTRLDNTTSK